MAMTRAKEKLIISARLHAKGTMYKKVSFDSDGRIYPVFAERADSMREWVWSSILLHPDGGRLRELTGRKDIVPTAEGLAEFEIYCGGEIPEEKGLSESETNEIETEIDSSEIKERLDYVYPYSGAAKLQIKM